ncbi:hypothetical protein ACRAWG_16035 [Methylobacterium sp. P31]
MKHKLTDDEAQAWAYLGGFCTETEEKNGKTIPSRQAYYKAGSPEEQRSRQALANILRGNAPIHWRLREELANLFDPNEEDNPRQIKIAFRKRGTRTDSLRETVIASFIRDEVNTHGQTEAAFEEAAKRFGMKRSAVVRIWGRKRPTFEALGELKPLSPTKS